MDPTDRSIVVATHTPSPHMQRVSWDVAAFFSSVATTVTRLDDVYMELLV
jgi:hypothetical protein